MNAFSPNITSLIANAEAARGIKRDNPDAALAALRALSIKTALEVLETFAVKDLSDLGYGYERICDGITECRSDLADEAGI